MKLEPVHKKTVPTLKLTEFGVGYTGREIELYTAGSVTRLVNTKNKMRHHQQKLGEKNIKNQEWEEAALETI